MEYEVLFIGVLSVCFLFIYLFALFVIFQVHVFNVFAFKFFGDK